MVQKQLTPATEIKLRFAKKGDVTITDKEIFGQLSLVTEDEGCDSIVFINCKLDDIIFENFIVSKGVKFINCEIRSIWARWLKIPNFDATDFAIYSMSLKNTIINERFDLIDCKFNRGLGIEKGSTINNLIITNCHFEFGEISIDEANVGEHLDILNNKARGVNISTSIINSKTRLSGNTFFNMTLIATSFKKDVHIWGDRVTNGIILNDGIFEDDVFITAIESNGAFNSHGDEFKKKLFVKYFDDTNEIYGGCKEIYLDGCTVGDSAYFIGTSKDDNLFKLKKITLNLSDKFSGAIEFNKFIIEETILNGSNTKGKVKFEHNIFTILKFASFRNFSTLQFLDVQASNDDKSKLIITRSNLGATEFYNSNLKSFKNIHIRYSILSDIIASNVIWFNKKQLEPQFIKDRQIHENEWKNTRETWRQLKYAMEKQGNRITALEFKSYEMECYKNEHDLKYHSKEKAANWIILWLSQSNDFGLNYIKPFVLIIIAAIISYCFMVVGISPKLSFTLGGGCDDITMTIGEFNKYFPAFFKLLNPVYDVNKIFKVEDIHWGVSLVDFLYRITLAYLIFQLITAFRKFVK